MKQIAAIRKTKKKTGFVWRTYLGTMFGDIHIGSEGTRHSYSL